MIVISINCNVGKQQSVLQEQRLYNDPLLRKRCSLLNKSANLLYKIENREASMKPDHDIRVKILGTYDFPRLPRSREHARSSGESYNPHVITRHVHPNVQSHVR